MEEFENWLERAVYLYLLLHIFSQLAAREMYARYLRFFGSLCFLLFLLSPFFSMQKEGASLLDLLDETTCMQELENYRQDMQKMEYMQQNYYTDQYEEAIEEEVEKQAQQAGYEVEHVEVILDETYEIRQMSMTLIDEGEKGALTEAYRDQKKEKLKEILADVFDIKKEVVQIA